MNLEVLGGIFGMVVNLAIILWIVSLFHKKDKVVVKSWRASNQPINQQGHYVEIIGRKAGLIAWLSALIGIDPTVRIRVGTKWYEHNRTSLAGEEVKLIPLRKVSSIFNSYYRPWREALGIFVVSVLLGVGLGKANVFAAAVLVVLVGAAIALLYYFLNRPFQLFIYEIGGGKCTGVCFKRSLIENVEVNHEKVQYVCQIIQCLIEAENK